MSTPPMPHRIVSQSGMLSLSPGATNFPNRPMMMPAMITPMISICLTSLTGSHRARPRLPSLSAVGIDMASDERTVPAARPGPGGPWRPRPDARRSARRPQHERQDRDVADRVQEHARAAQHPADRDVDRVLVAQRLVPGGGRVLAVAPRRPGDRLDRLHGDAPLGADRQQRFEVVESSEGSGSSGSCTAAAPSRSRTPPASADAVRRP